MQNPSFDSTPCSSPLPVPPINIVSPAVSMTRLHCISPLPDQRRDSTPEDYFFSSLNLPVPKQFADNGSRRSSGVPESIQEIEENGNGDKHLLGNFLSTHQEQQFTSGPFLKVPIDNYEERDLLRVDNQSLHPSSEQRPPFAARYPDKPEAAQEDDPNVYVGETMNIIDTDLPVNINFYIQL